MHIIIKEILKNPHSGDYNKMFQNENDFSLHIEKLKQEKQNETILETIIEFCEDNDCDVEDVVKLLNTNLVQQLEIEAKQQKMMKDNTMSISVI